MGVRCGSGVCRECIDVVSSGGVRSSSGVICAGVVIVVMVGEMLRPLERITAAAQEAAAGSLSHRIALPGRDDELRQLADTFDDMLERLQKAFDEQRRFTANASHELRTPHATMRTLLEVARADPAGVDLERLLHRLDLTNERAIRPFFM